MGRKKFFILTYFIQTISYFIITFVPAGPEGNLSKFVWILQLQMFIQGICSSGRTAIGFIWYCELSPEYSHKMLSTFMNVSEGVLYIYLTVFFRFINKHTWYSLIYGASNNLFYLLLVPFIPESPKWL